MFPKQHGLTLLELTVVLLVLVALAGVVVPYVGGESDRTACIATDATLANVRDAIMGSGAGAGYLGNMGDLPHYHDATSARRDSLHFLFSDRMTVGSDTFTANDKPPASIPFNPVTGRGWRGPYLQGGASGDSALSHLPSRFTDPGLGYVSSAIAGGQSVVLDSFPAPDCGNGDCRSPVVLQVPAGCSVSTDTRQCARLVSAGPGGQLDTALSDAAAANRNDDRVLFLRMADPGHNQPCAN